MTQQIPRMESIWRDFCGPLDSELRSIVGDSALPLYDMVRYHLGWVDQQGKPRQSGRRGVPPLLCLLACEAVGGDYRQALPAAASLALAQNFLLVHDDIEDSSVGRHPTVKSLWGAAQAINAGDSMHTMARLTMLRLSERGVPDARVLEATTLLDRACLKLCEGQYLDISFKDRQDIGISEYLDMIRLKTAALFECSVSIGALLGTDNAEKRLRLAHFGEALGMAFQVQDDLSGIRGEVETSGKPTGGIQEKKKSLSVVFAMQNAGIRDRLLAIYSKEVHIPADIAEATELLIGGGAREYAEGVVADFYGRAIGELSIAPIPGASRAQLRAVAEALLG